MKKEDPAQNIDQAAAGQATGSQAATNQATANQATAGGKEAQMHSSRVPDQLVKRISGNTKFYIVLQVACVLCLSWLISREFMSHTIYQVGCDQVSKDVLQRADADMMQPGTNQMIKRLYGLDPDSYQGVVLYYPTTNMGSEELLVVKLSDLSQEKEVTEAIEKRLATQKKNFDGYGTYQTDMLNHSVIDVRGNYVLFVSAKDAAASQAAFENSLH